VGQKVAHLPSLPIRLFDRVPARDQKESSPKDDSPYGNESIGRANRDHPSPAKSATAFAAKHLSILGHRH
jgi:hypothetical protein